MHDLVTIGFLVGSAVISSVISAPVGGGLALIVCLQFFGVAWRMHWQRAPLASRTVLSWNRGFWIWSFVMCGSIGLMFVESLKLAGLWLLGIAMLAIAVLGLNMRETYYSFSTVTPEQGRVRYWFMVLSYGAFGSALVAIATYALGALRRL